MDIRCELLCDWCGRKGVIGTRARMKRRHKYRLLALAFLGATVFLVSAIFIPAMNSARIVGMSGKQEDGRFLVQEVDRGSPADAAGLRRGDLITAIDGRSISEWWNVAHTRLSDYLLERRSWKDRPIEVVALRENRAFNAWITVRSLQPFELLAYFMARLAVIIVLIALTVFLLSSNPKDSTALVIGVCFFAFAWWMSFDRPNWPEFLSPLLMNYSTTEFLFRELMVTSGMQIALSAIIHVMLIFPRQLFPKRVHRKIIPIVYLLPLSIMALTMYHYTDTGLVDHMSNVYTIRLWLDSFLLVLLITLIFMNSRSVDTRIQKEQGRFLLRTAVIVILLHVLLWNIPKLVTGSPLLPSYNWLLLIMLTVPVALTISIANHRLFGIRGLIRRRIRYLETLSQRRRNALGRRDDMIQSLSEEIEQLREELDAYITLEEPSDDDPGLHNRLARLEEEYPAIRKARHGNLLGISPLWIKVFEDAILASRGDIPVLIAGESGTGKTELARTIAAINDRPLERYREISCAQFEHADPAFALGKLFGIGKAHGLPNILQNGQTGLLEECDGGTLFLDDFDRLPLNVQDLLLYPLEGKAFEPGIGSGPPRRVSLKFILATNRDVDELVEEGKLRADVLARVGMHVHIPPLRDRPEDIPLLVEHFIRIVSNEFDHEIESVPPITMRILRQCKYQKGNVRELYAELRTATGKASLAQDPLLRSEYLSENILASHSRDEFHNHSARSIDSHTGDKSTHHDHGSHITLSDMSRELAVLRKNGFRIRPSEEELGLSHKSKTLSNHLRGRCIQALADHEWDPKIAARSLTGSDDPEINARVQRKMLRFIQSIRNGIAEGTEQRLFNNLPAVYHSSLTAAIRHFSK